MDGSAFDDLAKKLSATTTRREAVRLVGGALAAGALGALLPGRALAAGAGACADFCNQVFGKDTAATTQCIQAAKQGTGLCYSACGPSGAGGTLCGSPSSYASTTCCSGGETCQNGTCAAVCIPSGRQCDVNNPGACCSGSCNPPGPFPFAFCD